MGVTAQFMVGYVKPTRQRVARHGFTAAIASILSAVGGALGGAGAAGGAGGALAGLGTAASGAGALGTGLSIAEGATLASALPSIAASTAPATVGTGLSVAGGSTLAGAVPGIAGGAAGIAPGSASIAAGMPSLAATIGGEAGAGLPGVISTGAGPVSALTGGPPSSFGSMLSSGLDFYSAPGKNIGGEVGKMFGNEKLGSQIGQAGQAIMSGQEKPQQQGVPMPAQALSIAAPQAPAMPGMGSAMGGSGPSFHFNPQTGTVEYS